MTGGKPSTRSARVAQAARAERAAREARRSGVDQALSAVERTSYVLAGLRSRRVTSEAEAGELTAGAEAWHERALAAAEDAGASEEEIEHRAWAGLIEGQYAAEQGAGLLLAHLDTLRAELRSGSGG